MAVRISETIQGELLLLKNAYERDGFWYVLRRGIIYVISWPINLLTALFYRHFKKQNRAFTFEGQTYNYFYHSYNTTWKNERVAEVPIIWRIVEEYRGKRVLEVGNVLRHYFPCWHDVVDLNEKYPGVINQDIVDFKPTEKYDLIVSISTFEHVGWDQSPREPEKLLTALENLVEHVVAPGGKIVITIPLGYNTEMEKFLASRKMSFTHANCLRQLSYRTKEWEEVAWDEIRGKEFNSDGTWCGTNSAFIIGVIQSDASTG